MKFAIGFKYDKTINNLEMINQRDNLVGFGIMNQHLHDDAGLLGRADGSWSGIEGKVKSVTKGILSNQGLACLTL
jgi:hypothetical protein